MKRGRKAAADLTRRTPHSGRERIWLVIDPHRALLVEAPEAVRRLWGLPKSQDGQPIPLDAAMPAMERLRHLGTFEGRSEPASLILTFWTARGARTWVCRVTRSRSRCKAQDATVLVEPDLAAPSQALTAQASGSQDDRLAIVQHELRTPLAAIQAYADLLFETLPLAVPRDHVASLQAAARHALGVVAALTPWTRDGGELADLAPAPVDVRDTVARAVDLLRPLAARAAAGIRVIPTAAPCVVLSNERSLMQVLVNILANAIRHAGAAPSISIGVQLSRAGGAVIEVADSGSGIPAAILRRARGHVDVGGADGLGLVISRQFAARAGAKLVLGRTRSGGARVRIVFTKTAVLGQRAGRRAAMAR